MFGYSLDEVVMGGRALLGLCLQESDLQEGEQVVGHISNLEGALIVHTLYNKATPLS